MLGFLGDPIFAQTNVLIQILRTVTFYASLTHSTNVPFVHPTQHPQPQQRQTSMVFSNTGLKCSATVSNWSVPDMNLMAAFPKKEVDNSTYFNNHQESQHISTQPSPNLATRWPLTKALGAFEFSSSQPSCKVFEPRMDHNRRPLFLGISPAKLEICCQAAFPLLPAVVALMHLDICQNI